MQTAIKSMGRGCSIILALALLLALLSACGSARSVATPISTGSAPELSSDATPFIIDTDMSLDDWIAILYLLQRPDVEIRAITVSGTGVAHCDPGVQNALNLAALAGHPEIPVACGRETPLTGNRTFPEEWRSPVDQLYGLSLPQNPNPPSDQSAAALLVVALQNSVEPVSILALGPLTNVAEMLQGDPVPVERIGEIIIMGGALNVPGNVLEGEAAQNPVAEWNIYVDPYAAQIVLASGIPITLVPLDATNHVPVTMEFVERLGVDRTTPEAEFIHRVLLRNEDFIRSGEAYFWDPLAAVIASDPGFALVEQHSILVIQEGSEAGRTQLDEAGYPITLAVKADSAQFETLLLDVLNGRVH